jgi:hypothetical protein
MPQRNAIGGLDARRNERRTGFEVAVKMLISARGHAARRIPDLFVIVPGVMKPGVRGGQARPDIAGTSAVAP